MDNVPQEPAVGGPVARLRALARLAACVGISALFAAWLLVTAVVALLSGRRAAVVRQGARTLTGLSRVLLRVLGVRVTVQGAAAPPGPCLLCPNHVSYLDVLVLASVQQTVFVSRGDVAGWPGIGLLARVGGTVFIDRARKRDAARAGDAVGELLDGRMRVVVFLEGTATTGDGVLPFRSSLLEPACARPGVPCVAATVRYSVPEGSGAVVGRDVAWADESPFGAHVWRLLRLRRIDVRVTLHPPRTGTDRKALAAALERDCRSAF